MADPVQESGGPTVRRMQLGARLRSLRQAQGISRDQATTCLADVDKITAIVNRSEKDSTDLELTGTPSFFLNGKKINFTTWDAVEPVLQAAGAR